jgi:DNA-binding MarR family transcriptional regulator
MTPEQWENIGTIAGIIVSTLTVITALVGAIRWLWKRHRSRQENKLSEEEQDCIRSFDGQSDSLEWNEGMERRMLKICESLVKKQYLEEWSSSPSRAMVLFGLSDKGKETYKKLCLSNNANIVKEIRSAKKVFVDKITSASGSSKSDVHKVIRIMEEEGMLTPIKSDNRGTLFWTNKN